MRPPGCPRTMWIKTIQQDPKSNNISLNEVIDVAQNHPLWRLISTFGAIHSYSYSQDDTEVQFIHRVPKKGSHQTFANNFLKS